MRTTHVILELLDDVINKFFHTTLNYVKSGITDYFIRVLIKKEITQKFINRNVIQISIIYINQILQKLECLLYLSKGEKFYKKFKKKKYRICY